MQLDRACRSNRLTPTHAANNRNGKVTTTETQGRKTKVTPAREMARLVVLAGMVVLATVILLSAYGHHWTG